MGVRDCGGIHRFCTSCCRHHATDHRLGNSTKLNMENPSFVKKNKLCRLREKQMIFCHLQQIEMENFTFAEKYLEKDLMKMLLSKKN